MTDKPKNSDAPEKKKDEDEVLEPDQVVFDAAETAFMQNSDEGEKK